MTLDVFRNHIEGPGLFELEVVGESHYQRNIQTILDRMKSGNPFASNPFDRVASRVTARLVSDPSNVHDPNAVRVAISGLLVGYLDRSNAARIRKQLNGMGYRTIDATCSAIILGGFSESCGKELYGVRLDISRKSQHKPNEDSIDGSELTFFVYSSGLNLDGTLAYVGNSVNFWSPPNMPFRVEVYCRGGISGAGKLGAVPSSCIGPIQRHLQAGHEFDAKIVANDNDRWQIKCRLIPAEETAQRFEEQRRIRRERLLKELATPYRPRKPIAFTITATRGSLKSGDELKVIALPSIEAIIAHSGPQNVLLKCARTGEQFKHRCESALVQRLLRLQIECDSIVARVMKKSRSRQEQVVVSLQISPLS